MKKNFSYLRNLLKNDDTEAEIYSYGILTAVLCALAVGFNLVLQRVLHTNLFSKCFIHELLGIYCPGCGGTRAFIYLLHGNFIKSFIFHPFVPYAVIVGLIFYISQSLRYLTHGKIHGVKFHKWFIVIGIILLTGNWIIKNLLLLVFNFTILN